jgi:hypothetical protein
MKINLRVLALAAIAVLAPSLALAVASTPLQQQVMCSPNIPGEQGSRQIGTPVNSPVPSGTVYTLNSQGCAAILLADVGYMRSLGFGIGANLFSIQSTGALTSASTATTVLIGTLPAGTYISAIMLNEIAGAAITGGVDIGDAASGTQFVSAQALSANGLIMVADSAITRVVGSTGTPVARPVYATCHTSCNAGSVTITVLYSYF